MRGKGLVADKSGLWRWRVGDYRVVSSIYEDVVVINVIDVGHRRNIYLQAHHFRMRKICSLNRSDIHQRHTMTAVAPAIWRDICLTICFSICPVLCSANCTFVSCL
ncbi:type II toxin-antitoxin system RelE/ParE family toxin [uncultured Corynebacterium sp.]|uniref:type II toxin-antitoxin system RelE family toxin n=1 Tax=uncultured Corynebacterium sp. TaxID=159447 RepID=UPI0025EAAD3E|nr:type II toxin-antitoxin system RelE/ParE family toxin [uncultured Corynebacterium sp.]